MSKPNARPHTTPPPAGTLRVALMVLLLGALSGACSAAGDSGSPVRAGDRIPASEADVRGASMSHVHGLGRNPGDGDVYVATHHGLWRVRKEGEPDLVGRHQHDFMGFSVVGPDRFVASGHPNSADSLPPHLGLIESKDAGRTWRSRSLLGLADFHALRTAGKVTLGWNSQDGALLRSDDGRDWVTLQKELPLLDMAIHPDEPRTVVASLPKGEREIEVARRTADLTPFERIPDAPQLVRFAWPEPDRLFGFDTAGAVWRSEDSGDSWTRVGETKALPDAVAGAADELLAAAGGRVLSSTDDGRSWQQLATYD